jgi:hypothetical protein
MKADYHNPYGYEDGGYPRQRAIEPERRIGHQHRNKAIDRLGYNIAHGYLTEEEGEQRRAKILVAKVEDDLRKQLADLAEEGVPADAPPEARIRARLRRVTWSKPQVFLPVGLGGITFSLLAAIVPGVVMASIPAGKGSVAGTALGLAIWLPLVIIGIIGIVASVAAMIVMSETE